jgi:transcriptional regulator with XRE-family HTH domain
MSPLADLLRRIRLARALRQEELASLVGCERSYLSALENDLHLTPPLRLVERVARALNLDPAEEANLYAAAERSKRKHVISADLPPAAFELANELLGQLDRLTEAQIEALRKVLALGPGATSSNTVTMHRVPRRDKRAKEVAM